MASLEPSDRLKWIGDLTGPERTRFGSKSVNLVEAKLTTGLPGSFSTETNLDLAPTGAGS